MTSVNMVLKDLNGSLNNIEQRLLKRFPGRKSEKAVLGMTQEFREAIVTIFPPFSALLPKEKVKDLLDRLFHIGSGSMHKFEQKRFNLTKKGDSPELTVAQSIVLDMKRILLKLENGEYDEIPE